ncbi:MAG TPA: class I SAM-dependent methyltransferase, partial [Beijerinckiaceae bacterium]
LDSVVVREIENLARARGAPLRILEAGCGQKWSLDLGTAAFHLTGVDLDKDALDIRLNQRRDLHHAIHGDLATVDLPKNAFDVIYCSYVLEHVPDADVVLGRMYEWLAPGGLLVLRLPAPESFRGFVTRVTPHWFHVAYYRWVKGQKNAGRPGHGPSRHPARRTARTRARPGPGLQEHPRRHLAQGALPDGGRRGAPGADARPRHRRLQ